MPTPLLYHGLVYIVHHNGRLVAHDPATGGPVYRARFSEGGTCTNSPVAGNGVIYQGNRGGHPLRLRRRARVRRARGARLRRAADGDAGKLGEDADRADAG
jgi:hypothetical protein